MEVRDGVWRVDLEVGRDPVTGRRRRVSRRDRGSRVDAEAALAKLRVSADERAARLLGISRSLAYDMANRWIATAGDDGLPAVRLGRRILINRVALERWATGSWPHPSQ
ncbi:hypothetical protein BH23ACT3_BH23ACT3_07650 [soil metagenome]